MAELHFTTKSGSKPHTHIIYIDADTGDAVCSTCQNHTHEVFPTETVMVLSTDLEHTHQVIPIPVQSDEVKPPTGDDEEVVSDALSLFKTACEYEDKSRKSGKEAYEFFKGNQWDKGLKSELNSKKRATQVYNYIQSKIDVLSGLARQNRTDPRAFPVEGSDGGVADIATAALVRISKNNVLASEEIRVFEDEVITGRGLFHVYISQDRDPRGDIIIERFPWADGYLGVHSKLDASDATHAHKAKWISVAEAKSRYPELKDYIDGLIADSREEINTTNLVQDPGSKGSTVDFKTHPEIIDQQHRRIRLIEHEIKEFKIDYNIVSPDETVMIKTTREVFNKLKELPSHIKLVGIKTTREIIRVVTTIGDKLISNEYPFRPYNGFSLIPSYAYKFDDGTWFGKVEAMKHAQMEINKRGSQGIDIVNRMLGRGWFIDPETFNSPSDENKFIENSGSSGWVQKVQSVERPPRQADSMSYPPELFNLHQLNLSIMEGVSNITSSLSGQQQTGYESGSAILRLQRSGLVGNERVFDNFILSKQTMFRNVFRLMQEFYSPARIARIVLSEASDTQRSEPLTIGDNEISPFRSPQEDEMIYQDIQNMLDTTDLLKYDIQIGEQIFSATNKEAQFTMWSEAATHGLPVPLEMLIELSSLPNKGKWNKIVKEQESMRQQMEQMKYTAELQKAGRIPVNPTNEEPR